MNRPLFFATILVVCLSVPPALPAVPLASPAVDATAPAILESLMTPPPASPTLVIREMPIQHCKRGPDRCDVCKTRNRSAFCLIDITPPNPGMVQRPVIAIPSDGKTEYREYDVVKVFQSEAEAREYARSSKIPFLPAP